MTKEKKSKLKMYFSSLSLLHFLGMGAGVLVLLLDLASFRGTRWFIPLLVLALTVLSLPFWLDFFLYKKRQRELETYFPDFVGDLVNTVKSGVPISQGIIQISDRDYGALSAHVKKLARQIEWAVPLHKALTYFADRIKNPLISRTISTVIEAEKSGGNIEDVLRGITTSLIEIKELKDRRRALIHSQVIQSYVIFAVFLIVMIFIENSLVPYLARIQGGTLGGAFGGGGQQISTLVQEVKFSFASVGDFFSSLIQYLIHLEGIFTMLAVIQGLFAGLVVGKLSEGEVTAGLKHSLILATAALFVMTLF
ncbi:type II secretion system F family protein [Candidatus Woesearchaeota archaeon]|nr:type II secretion system F family protein [Candidatus Woesearchaeota archaeon]MBW3017033.1 type II secretion system F family protein [Candidatus Woesearchaeota archaeon]